MIRSLVFCLGQPFRSRRLRQRLAAYSFDRQP